MSETSWPWGGTIDGDAGPYSAEQWQSMYLYLAASLMSDPNGSVLPETGIGGVRALYVKQTGSASTSVVVTPGSAIVQGVWYRNDAEAMLPVTPNASGHPRYDTVVLRVSATEQTVRLAIKQGTPGAAPAVPTLTQVAGTLWEMPLAHIYLANGFLNIPDAVITNVIYRSRLEPPAGLLAPYAGAVAPAGWLLCHGQAVNRRTYDALFAAIGTTYGSGDGATTFNLPDLRGRVPIGLDNLGGVSANRVTAAAADTLGGTGGTEKHTLTVNEMPSHRHQLKVHPDPSSGAKSYWATRPFATMDTNASFNFQPPLTTMDAAGGDQPHENMQPYLALGYIIKF